MNAAAVSRFLSANGVRPLPSGTPRSREGIRVRNSHQAVYVVADYDGTGTARVMAEGVAEVLRLRYAVSVTSDGTAMYVTERQSA